MNGDELYLRGNVVVEPLFCQWYAWANLLSPATAPLYVAEQQIKIMQSFVAQPHVHVAATRNPELIGGPFIGYGVERVGEIRALLERTIRQQAKLCELSAAVRSLDALLSEHPRGMSLEDLYPRIPAPLRGYVELGYDLRNQPSLRLLEGLLYRSPYHDEAAQSLMIWPMGDDARPFVYSTPRLEEPGSLHLAIPFRHRAVDVLAALRRTPAKRGEIREALGVRPEQEAVLASLLTSDPPPPAPARWAGPGVRVRYFGHACVLIESPDVAVLTDPLVSYDYPTSLPRFTLADLPERIDYVLITHAHADHFALETLLALRGRVGTIVVPKNSGALQDPSLRLALEHAGFRGVRELEEADVLDVPGGAVVGLPFLGEHGDLAIRTKLSYLVRLGGRSTLIAADSNVLDPAIYLRAREMIGGDLDALFLGMECAGAPMSWSYGPLLLAQLARRMDQSRRLNGSNCQRAMLLVEALGPRQVYVYAMGQEPWLGHVMGLQYTETSPQIVESNELLSRCRAAGLVAERPYAKHEIVLP